MSTPSRLATVVERVRVRVVVLQMTDGELIEGALASRPDDLADLDSAD